MWSVIAADMDLRLRIEGLALAVKSRQDFRRIALLEQWPRVASTGPLNQCCDIGINPYRDGIGEDKAVVCP